MRIRKINTSAGRSPGPRGRIYVSEAAYRTWLGAPIWLRVGAPEVTREDRTNDVSVFALRVPENRCGTDCSAGHHGLLFRLWPGPPATPWHS
jgi:hypothetical protein